MEGRGEVTFVKRPRGLFGPGLSEPYEDWPQLAK